MRLGEDFWIKVSVAACVVAATLFPALFVLAFTRWWRPPHRRSLRSR